MVRSFDAAGFVLAALALPVSLVGTAAAARRSTTDQARVRDAERRRLDLPVGFNQVVIGDFKQVQKAVTINYQGNGSGAGRTDFVNKVVDFAGTDAPYTATDAAAEGHVPLLPDRRRADHGVVQPVGRHEPQALGRHHRQDLPGPITTWNDAAIKTDNPKAKLPSTTITVVHRSDGSGTTQNFTTSS